VGEECDAPLRCNCAAVEDGDEGVKFIETGLTLTKYVHAHLLASFDVDCTAFDATSSADSNDASLTLLQQSVYSLHGIIGSLMSVDYWRYVALVVVLWCLALSSSSSSLTSVTALR